MDNPVEAMLRGFHERVAAKIEHMQAIEFEK
jgi:hypothetical protein